MAFTLGNSSRAKLVGVHPVFVELVDRAIVLTKQDFTVFEGPRTLAHQKELLAAGASKTLDSMHIPAPDRLKTGAPGLLAHAGDLVPWIAGGPRWEIKPCFMIAVAVAQAAHDMGIADKVCWGCVWDRWMSQYPPTPAGIEAEVAAYSARTRARKKAAGRPQTVFLDGPHFQIGRLG